MPNVSTEPTDAVADGRNQAENTTELRSVRILALWLSSGDMFVIPWFVGVATFFRSRLFSVRKKVLASHLLLGGWVGAYSSLGEQ